MSALLHQGLHSFFIFYGRLPAFQASPLHNACARFQVQLNELERVVNACDRFVIK